MRRVATLLSFGVLVGCSVQATQPEPNGPLADAGPSEPEKPSDETKGDKPIGETKVDKPTDETKPVVGTKPNANTAVSSSVGINLSGVNYYATQLPFSNLFLNRDRWLSTDGMTWDTEQAASIPVDADGYPVELPYEGLKLQVSAFLPVQADTYVATWQGDGAIYVHGPDIQRLELLDNSLSFKLSASMSDSVFLRIERSSADNPVRKIEIHGTKDNGSAFRESLDGFGVLRFMDWGATNHSPVAHWSERTTVNQAQGTEHGVAIEHMVDTANAVHADMWFNVPHKADDDYIQRAAQLIADRLDKKLKVYVEYSNENWNGIFSQVQWEQKQGVEAGLDEFGTYKSTDESEFWAGMNFAVRRAGFVHNVFSKVLGDRAVRVLAGQSANAGLNEAILSAYEDPRINLSGGKADALAVAPYFGRIYSELEGAESITVARILADAEESIDELVVEDTRANRKVADAHDVHLIAYEAGQHVLATGGLENTDFLQRVIAANRDSRMGELYRKAHRAWLDNGGELIVYFTSCELPNKFGSWGAREYQDQPVSEAPKWAALRAIMQN